MTGNYEQRLQVLRNQIDAAKQEKARAEATLQMVEQRRAELHKELAELSVKPEELDETIKALEAKLEASLAEAEGLIPEEFKVASAALNGSRA